MTAQQHSLSLPLRIVPQSYPIVDIVEDNGRVVCQCDEYDAQELVRCVNSFRDLLKAVTECWQATGEAIVGDAPFEKLRRANKLAREAITLANKSYDP
jgi:hypothetical protein